MLKEKRKIFFTILPVVFIIAAVTVLLNCERRSPQTAAGKPSESSMEPFFREAFFETEKIFSGGRFPNIAIALDGSVLAFWGQNSLPQLRRSEDGGRTWQEIVEIGEHSSQAGSGLGAAVVSEVTGDVIVFMDGVRRDWSAGHSWRSRDHGISWEYNGARSDIVASNSSADIRGEASIASSCFTHGHDSGITLRHGEHRGRLLISARAMPGSNDPEHWPQHYNCAIFSDDGGYTWQSSNPFPAFGTGEASLEELSDGRIYYNSRRHWAPEGENARMRHIAWSYDGGNTWENLSVSNVLPDGSQHEDYGLMGGLVRLPVQGKDILLYSNIVSTGPRHNGYVWASFDGGLTWPVKRQVHAGPFAYSSMAVGRPATSSEGWIYLFYEGGEEQYYEGGYVARFNLSWVLDTGSEITGDGELPYWVRPQMP